METCVNVAIVRSLGTRTSSWVVVRSTDWNLAYMFLIVGIPDHVGKKPDTMKACKPWQKSCATVPNIELQCCPVLFFQAICRKGFIEVCYKIIWIQVLHKSSTCQTKSLTSWKRWEYYLQGCTEGFGALWLDIMLGPTILTQQIDQFNTCRPARLFWTLSLVIFIDWIVKL